MDNILNSVVLQGILVSGISIATPLLLAAIGEVFVEQAGSFNMGIEGIMLSSCFLSFVIMHYTDNLILACVSSIVIGSLIGGLIAFLIEKIQANAAIVGILFNFLGASITTFFFRLIFGVSMISTTVRKLPNFSLFGGEKVPFLGVLLSQNPLVYLAFLLVPFSAFILNKTNFGLNLRTVGGSAEVAETLGINVERMKYVSWLIGGGLAGLAGAYLILTSGIFVENMTSNRGFIAMAIVVFARLKPKYILGGGLLFGLSDALQLRLQAIDFAVPHQILLMSPYILTILVLFLSEWRKKQNA